MKKLGLIGAILLVAAAPAWARVDIKCAVDYNSVDGNLVTVSYRVVSEPNKVRAFALDIMVTSPAKIGDVNNYPVYPGSSLKKYWVYPGSIVIGGTPPDVTDAGTPVANPYDPCVPGGTQPGLDSNGVTIEMGSLYYPTQDSSPNSPAGIKTGSNWDQPGGGAWERLLQFRVNKRPATPVYVTITENTVRGGVVLTNGGDPDVNAPIHWPLDCLIGGNADGAVPGSEYAAWIKFGRPRCWCFERQCRGELNNIKQGSYWVYTQDLTLLKSGYMKPDSTLAGITNGICGDINHSKQGSYRVYTQDLTTLKVYYMKPVASVPTCEKAPVIGPFNWWSNN